MDVSRLHRCWSLVTHFGPSWLLLRACHAARMKSGLIRRQCPMTAWDDRPLSRFLNRTAPADMAQYAQYRRSSAPRFFFDSSSRIEYQKIFERWDKVSTSPQAQANDVRNGFVQFFSHERVEVGFPPLWHRDPFTGTAFPTDRHWSQIGDFGAGDIKLVWETNRFGFTFPLVRSYWRAGNEQYAELFWQLVENWRASNRPQTGANWKCGQEISLRVMAWCFGLYGFLDCQASTPDRIAMLAQMIAVSGGRIESNIGYALSQKNNHGLSEAMGLWTIGALFPEFTSSSRWSEMGRRLLESQARELVYDDGAFSQHSMNYHRVMLHDYLWSIRLANIVGRPFSTLLRNRIARAGDFLYQLQDEFTGRVPCYGQNDGALILPLTNCDYGDFRPVVQAAGFLADGQRRFKPGPWDEELLWLFGPTACADEVRAREDEAPTEPGIATTHRIDGAQFDLSLFVSRRETQRRGGSVGASPSRMENFDAPDGGYSTLRSANGFALMRAAKFRHRPGQADMLHVDIWWRGENVALDPGTYSYNAAPPWDNRLAHTGFHNTVTVDNQDQMERAGRFLWLPWLRGDSFGQAVSCRGDVDCWNGEHDGYRRLPDGMTHRRGVVRIGADHWLIIDSLQGRRPHLFRLHWLLIDAPLVLDRSQKSLELRTSVGRYRLAATSSTEASFNVIRAASDSPAGWCSPYYHSLEPAVSVCLEANAPSVVFATVLGPDAEPPNLTGQAVDVVGPDWTVNVSLNLASRGGTPLVIAADAGGSLRNLSTSTFHSSERSTTESYQCTSC